MPRPGVLKLSTHDSTVTADISGPARELDVMDSRFRKPPFSGTAARLLGRRSMLRAQRR